MSSSVCVTHPKAIFSDEKCGKDSERMSCLTKHSFRDVKLLSSIRSNIELERWGIPGKFSNTSESFTSTSESSLRCSESFLPIHANCQRDRTLHRVGILQLPNTQLKPAQSCVLNQ